MNTSRERTEFLKVPYWVDIFGVLKEVSWEKKPDAKHRPLAWADRPIPVEKLKELFAQAERNPLKYARLIEAEHGIKKWETEDRVRETSSDGA